MKVYTKKDMANTYTSVMSDYMNNGYSFSINGNDTSYGCVMSSVLEKGLYRTYVVLERLYEHNNEFNGSVVYRVAAYESYNGSSDVITVYDTWYTVEMYNNSSVCVKDFSIACECMEKHRERSRKHYNPKWYIYHYAHKGEQKEVSDGLKNALLTLVHRERGFKSATWDNVQWVERCANHKYVMRVNCGKTEKELLIGF